jgi:YjbE family integral membrane protein
MDFILDVSQIVLADIVLSGDNALIIGMAAASFAEKDRRKIIFFGLLTAAILRILFALIASYLITVPGLLLVGALLLYWVCFKFYQDIKEFSKNDETNKEDVTEKVKGKSMKNALITITIADISMSLDNVIAVTAIARDQTYLLMFGIGFSILLIAIFASAIVRLLTKFKWLSYVGLVFLIYLSTEMAIDGYFQIKPYISF